MVRRASPIACVVMIFGFAIALEGQSKTPNNQTPAQADERREPPSQQAQPSATYEIFNAAPNQPDAAKEKSYGGKFVENLLTDPIVWLTVALTFLALVQLKVYRAEVRDMRATERAYLALSHTPEGLHPFGDSNTRRVAIEIKNAGNTPTAVDFGYVRLVIDLPKNGHWFMHASDERNRRLPGGFLVREKTYSIPIDFTLTDEEKAALSEYRLWLVAWVYYVDAFDQPHRAGYARFVKPNQGGNNLMWDAASARYNYDEAVTKDGQRLKGKPRLTGTGKHHQPT